MVTCFICNTVVINVRALKVHFQVFHQHHRFEQYHCVEDNCFRSYHLFNSFRRHYFRDHSSQLNNLTEENEQYPATDQVILVETDGSPSLELVSHSDLIEPVNDHSSSEQSSNQTHPCNFVVTPEVPLGQDLPHVSLEMALASLVASLYGSVNLPRNIVQII